MRHVPIAALVTCCIAACPASTDSKEAQTETQPTNHEPSLHAGFSNFTRSVTTASPEAQQWFDQGLQLLYGSDRSAAIAAFTPGRQTRSTMCNGLVGTRIRVQAEHRQPA